MDSVAGLKGKRFAVIIDEAHSSTAGKDMAAVTMSLGSGEQESGDVEDMITDEIRRNGKQANVSMFAFTATPKPTTIQLFGRLNTKGQREAFHIYSMKQAIEEGFILDVLQNYTTYDTFYQLNKEIEEDPRCKTADAKRQIARFVELHETNIAQRVEVIVEHFRTTVMPELGGMAKAMVITASRQGAVKYRQAFENYTQKKGYTDIKALVAFSGKVKLPDDDTEYSEASMNGFPEDRSDKGIRQGRLPGAAGCQQVSDRVRPAEALRYVCSQEAEGRFCRSDAFPPEPYLPAVREENLCAGLCEYIRGYQGGVRTILYDHACFPLP